MPVRERKTPDTPKVSATVAVTIGEGTLNGSWMINEAMNHER